MKQVTTTEALMTDPTIPEGATYWQERHGYEERIEGLTGAVQLLLSELRRAHPPHHDVEGCRPCGLIRRVTDALDS